MKEPPLPLLNETTPSGNMSMCSEHHFQCFTFEVNDTNSRPSISSISGCIAPVSDGLRTTVEEAAAVLHSLPRKFDQRLFIFFLLLQNRGDDPGVDVEELAVTDLALGDIHTFKPCCTSGATLVAALSCLGATSTSSPRACLPLMQGTYGSSFLAGLDIMGFSTNRVSCTFDREAESF